MDNGFDEAAARRRYWDKRLGIKDDPMSVRVAGTQYVILEQPAFGIFQGHGGADFYIEFDDGRLMHTRNLWLNGEIPATHRELLPDNAAFLSKEQFEGKLAARKASVETIPEVMLTGSHIEDTDDRHRQGRLAYARNAVEELRESGGFLRAEDGMVVYEADVGALDGPPIARIESWSALVEHEKLSVLLSSAALSMLDNGDTLDLLKVHVDFDKLHPAAQEHWFGAEVIKPTVSAESPIPEPPKPKKKLKQSL